MQLESLPFRVEYLAPGLIQEYSPNGLLTTFILHGSNANTLEAWITSFDSLLLEWPRQHPCLVLHDLRAADACQAIDLLQRHHLETKRPELNLHIALIIDGDATFPCRDKLTCEQHIFLSRGTALFWLLEQVNK